MSSRLVSVLLLLSREASSDGLTSSNIAESGMAVSLAFLDLTTFGGVWTITAMFKCFK